ncbi:BNA4 [Candida oxycetoniae]|uniref:Kynurenine 3-monooxygenase n=1 Tax=Candida oxycetoniae TaxID=497107 RepID=A0AAI9STE9_9ASCO|nr:BNA4 [Candida oxycetoniae]KAI3402595.1 BNA4 [Candida oxycetoniae]
MDKIKEKEGTKIGVVGAGLVGCLAALAFVSKGYKVTLFESRPDPKLADASQRNLRSINLAVSNRGIRALRYVDDELAEKVLSRVTPMKGRMIHDITGLKQESQLYGLNGECINSIDRAFLNNLLLDELRSKNVELYFEHKLVKLSNMDRGGDRGGDQDQDQDQGHGQQEQRPVIEVVDTKGKLEKYEFDYIIGADGAHSQFRYQMQKHMRMDFSQKYIDMQYIELYIPPDGVNKFSIDPNHLHIWPRHKFMLIALANEDGSFTTTFFSPWSVIESIKSSKEFVEFFKENFPDAVKLIGEEALAEAYVKNPRGSLMQVSAFPYNSPQGKALIIGDAAHSMVPFYGQGMNCGFEDVRIMMELIDKHKSIEQAFVEYSPLRKKDLDAICTLALENYYEMSSKVTNVWYLAKKKIDYSLGRWLKNKWLPLYTMISFRDDIPYSKAVEIEKAQSRIITNLQIGIFSSVLVYGIVQGLNLYDKFNVRNMTS